ncbi:MAG: hypothetical protein QOF10_1470, partial [Kribbellaceae bacterium]|nr:hypothetical protein [Kribbellaceae bacterium]
MKKSTEPKAPRRIMQLAIAGVAVAAVAVVSTTAARTSKQAAPRPDAASAPAVVPVAAPGAVAPNAVADPLAGGPGKLLRGGYEVQSKVDPSAIKPAERPLPKDSVAACKTLLATTDEPKPGRNAKVVARFDGAPGSVLVLADGNYWAGCDTAYGRHDGQGSLRKPAKIR